MFYLIQSTKYAGTTIGDTLGEKKKKKKDRIKLKQNK